MGEKSENAVYVGMMLDSLKRKEGILTSILTCTKRQETLLKDSDMDADEFQTLIDQKGALVDELNEMDEVFDVMFRRVESEVKANPALYEDKIKEMQKQIPLVSELGMQIQALEHQNEGHFKAYLARQKKEIREFHLNHRTVANYYQNMPNTHRREQSYFFDETK